VRATATLRRRLLARDARVAVVGQIDGVGVALARLHALAAKG
jgi:hypothetical protein